MHPVCSHSHTRSSTYLCFYLSGWFSEASCSEILPDSPKILRNVGSMQSTDMCCSLNRGIFFRCLSCRSLQLVTVWPLLSTFCLMLMMMRSEARFWIRQLSAAGSPAAKELIIDDRAVSWTYLTALSSAVSPSYIEMHTIKRM